MENRQTAVEWLAIQLYERMEMKGDGRVFDEILEQAKQMEKQQLIDAHGDEQSHLQDDGSWRTVSAEQYYNETYGSDKLGGSLDWNGEVTQGSNGNFKQYSLYEHKETIATADTPTREKELQFLATQSQEMGLYTPQTEISDEEIEKASIGNATFAPSFINGAKWYREQLKKKL